MWNVSKEGALVWVCGGNTGTAKLTITNGRLHYASSTGRTGIFDYHEGDGKRVLRTRGGEVELRHVRE